MIYYLKPINGFILEIMINIESVLFITKNTRGYILYLKDGRIENTKFNMENYKCLCIDTEFKIAIDYALKEYNKIYKLRSFI